MKFYLFHRPPAKPERKAEDADRTPALMHENSGGASLFSEIRHDEDGIWLTYDFYTKQRGTTQVTALLKFRPWSVYCIELRNNNSFPPRIAFLNKTGVADCSLKYVGADVRCYLGCVLFTDQEALVYLSRTQVNYSGAMKHKGFEMVEMNASESSSGAFSRFSQKAKILTDVSNAGRLALETTDYIGAITALSAQVDLLSRTLLASEVLQEGDDLESLKALLPENPTLIDEAIIARKKALEKELSWLSEIEKRAKAPKVDPETFGKIPIGTKTP